MPTSIGSLKKLEFQNNIYFCFIDYTKAFDSVDHNKLENSSRDGNTRPPDLPPEKSVFLRSRSNSYNRAWNNRLVPNWKGVHQGCILSPQSWGIAISILPLSMELSYHFTMRQLKPEANTRSEVTTLHSVPRAVLLNCDNSLHKISAQPSALCPLPGKERFQTFAELGADSL